MRTFTWPRALLLAWGVAMLGFVALIWQEWQWRLQLERQLRVKTPALVLAELKLLPEFTLGEENLAYQEILARPLFVPTRRPLPPQAVTAMKKGQFTLLGVTGLKDRRYALLRENATGKVETVGQGARLREMTVDSVENEKVILKQGDDTETLMLQVQRSRR